MTHPVSVNMAWVLEFCLPCLPESSNLLVSTQKYSVRIYFFLLGKLVMIGFIPNLPILRVSWHPDQIIFIDPTGPKKSRAKKKKLLKKQSSPAKILILKVKLLNILSWRLHVPEMVNLPHCNILWSMTVWVPNLSGFHFLLFGWFCQREACYSGLYCSEFVHPQCRNKFDPRKEIIRAYCCAVLCAVDKLVGGRGPSFNAEVYINWLSVTWFLPCCPWMHSTVKLCYLELDGSV